MIAPRPRSRCEFDRAAARALGPERTRHRDDFVAHEREIHDLLALRLHRLLADESADARRGRGPGLRRLRDAHRVVADGGRIVGVRLEEIRRRHDRIERVVHVVHHAGGELADRGEAPFARARFLEREQLGVRSWTMRSSRSASVDTRSYSSAVRRASSSSALASCVFTVTSRSTVTAPRIFPVLVVQRIRVDLDDQRRAFGAAAHGERLAAHALAAQRASRGMLVHEEARAVDRARAVELPELAKRRRLARGAA